VGHYVKVSGKGQITLPAEIRKKLGLTSGSFLETIEEGKKFILMTAILIK